MTLTMEGLILCVTAYLLGSIPFGLIFSKIFGATDPRFAGSGNIGFSNVVRLSGKKVGTLTLIGDFGKGLLVSWLAISTVGTGTWAFASAFCVVVGHIFSIFLGFHGGKGVATGLGAMLGLHPIVGLIMIAIWFSAVGIWRYSSGGALTAFFALPILGMFMINRADFIAMSLGITGLVFFRHIENIKKIMDGTESKVGVPDS